MQGTEARACRGGGLGEQASIKCFVMPHFIRTVRLGLTIKVRTLLEHVLP